MLRNYNGFTRGNDLIRRFAPQAFNKKKEGEPKISDSTKAVICTFLNPPLPTKKKNKETPAECLRKHRRYFVYKDREFRCFSLLAMSYQDRMDMVKEVREMEIDHRFAPHAQDHLLFPPKAYLRKDVPGDEETEELLHLPQNSPKWQFLRRYFVGASESAKMLDMDGHMDLNTFHITKLGVFGFENQVKLEFNIGHFFEDLAGDSAIKIARECWGIKDFGTEDIGVIPSLPGTWASIDKVITGEGFIPWELIKKWDPTWHCGWELTEEEKASKGIPLSQLNMELKTGVNYTIIDYLSRVMFPSKEHVIQTQEQMRACGLSKNPYYSNRRYTLICQMKPPFVNHVKEENCMRTTILGAHSPSGVSEEMGTDYLRAITKHYGKPWVTNMWLVRKDQAFLDAAEKRINYFMEQHHSENLHFYDYPPEIPEPVLPKCIYLGSYAFQGPTEDVHINMVPGTEVAGLVNEPLSINDLALVEETRDGKMYFPRPGSLLMSFQDQPCKINYYSLTKEDEDRMRDVFKVKK